MGNYFDTAMQTSPFFFMPTSANTFIFMLLQLMLFWRRKIINFLVFLHMVIVAGIFSGAWLISDMFLLIDNIEQHQVSEAIFMSNISIVQRALLPLCCIWIYQSWAINKESAKIDNNP